MMADLGGTGRCPAVKVRTLKPHKICVDSVYMLLCMYFMPHMYVLFPQHPVEVVLQEQKGLFYLLISPGTTPPVRRVSTLYLYLESSVSSFIDTKLHTASHFTATRSSNFCVK